ncbi:MAG: MupA/Atu3671 family FMN-dependent luciferase-like monooxygenase [Nannocystaceae bacterium]
MEEKDIESRRENLSDEKRALLAKRLKGRRGQGKSRRIPRRSDPRPARLSLAQERLWVLHQLEPESTAYHVPSAFRLRGRLDAVALRRAIDVVVQRHEVLRTTFRTEGESQVQVVSASVDLEFVEHDLRGEGDAEQRGRALLADQAVRLFSLADGPLIRTGLLRLEDELHILYVVAHHAVSDGWSLGVMLRELTGAYAALADGLDPTLEPLPIQYGDFSEWQRSMLSGTELERQVEYWRGCLGGDLPVLEMPTDSPRPAIRSHHGAMLRAQWSREVSGPLEALAQQEGATFFMVLLAAFNVLLYRYTGQEDLIVGTPIANRTSPETEPLIGFFANTLALRTELGGQPSFRELLRRVKTACLEAYAHQDLPFQKLVEVLRPRRDMSRTPVYQSLFVFMDASMNQAPTAGGLSWRRERIEADIAQTDLVLYVEETTGGLSVALEYGTDLFARESMARFLENYRVLLKSVSADPDAKIGEAELISGEERERLLRAWNQTAVDYRRSQPIHALFEAQVARTPDAEALAFEDEVLTYRQLNERANRMAHHLRGLGVAPEFLVGICMERGVELVVGLLGILKAGGAYLPLDPAYPLERIEYMLTDSGAQVVVTNQRCAKLVALPRVNGVLVDTHQDEVARNSATNPTSGVDGDNLAYVIYTSGSTGRPKGVMVQHRNVHNFFVGMDERIAHSEPAVWLAVTSISFDISVLELFWTLGRGFKLVLYGADDRSSAADQATKSGSGTPVHAEKHIAFSLFYFASDEAESGGDKYRLLLEGAKFADTHGFTAVWTPERHFHAFGGLYPNPAVASAALATITERVDIRAGSCVLPLHDPVRVAEDWALVDNLSGGRVGIAAATGWQPNDFVLKPENYDNRRTLMFEQIETVRHLWRGGTLTRKGGDGKAFELQTLPRPVQKELPIWVTSGGYNPETFRDAAKAGANLLTHLLGQDIDDLARNITAYREAWAAAGQAGHGAVSLMLHTFVGPDAEQAKKIVRGPFTRYLRGSIGLFKPFAERMGLDFSQLTPQDMDTLAERAFERYYETNGLFGTPESCVALVDELKGVGVDEIACLIDFGIPSETVLENLPYLDQLRGTSVARENADAAVRVDYSVPGLIRQHAVTHMQCTPSMASMLTSDTAQAEALGQLDHWLVGGEALTGELAGRITDLTGGGAVTNMYGPTETTIWSTTYSHTGRSGPVPIGRPIANTQLYVLDGLMRPVPIGATGELYIAGDGVVRGYLNRAELTAERFPTDPFSGVDGGRMYRTGDLVRYRSDGVIEFLGRNDAQVKLRGYRIELGEIEARIGEDEAVDEVVVLLREDVPGDKRLVAYLVAERGQTIELDRIRERLKAGVADYMLPAGYVVLKALPLTPNKKIDRKALPAPDLGASAATAEYVEPGGGVETLIAEIWGSVLKLPQVGVHDNFFDLGGHSLLIVHVLSQLRAQGKSLQMTDLFRFPTIRGLAQHLDGHGSGPGGPGQGGAGGKTATGRGRAAARRARQLGLRPRGRAQ